VQTEKLTRNRLNLFLFHAISRYRRHHGASMERAYNKVGIENNTGIRRNTERISAIIEGGQSI